MLETLLTSREGEKEEKIQEGKQEVGKVLEAAQEEGKTG
jgi:hypothetical protein